jgi:hypothetical protein
VLFSAGQRAAATDADRVCIGREGHVRVSADAIVTWEEGLLRDHEPRTRSDALTTPPDDKHLGSNHREIWHPPAITTAASGLPPVTLSVHCNRGPQTHVLESTQTSPLFPLATVPVSRRSLRIQLAQLATERPDLRAALCPHVALDDDQLLLPFEQGQCACFGGPLADGHDTGHLRFALSGSPERLMHGNHGPGGCCRCWSESSDPQMSSNSSTHHLALEDGLTAHDWDRHDSYRTLRCRHTYKCPACPVEYAWLRLGDVAALRIHRRQFVHPTWSQQKQGRGPGPTNWCWIKMLDPESWGITEDHELRNVLWCEDRNCATRQRWSVLGRVLLKTAL